ncbi:pirin family protein [Halopseudomonas maritima]|uniref:pirin family protein n=1 Tax=Halopseudomonas maritima TaxID=2918528 RepID=UPI001EEADC11|nr:pirin family protein [Halopseudomonas maritima]UJJ32257.1 pirin family protein [Halopseudomonas maritima]
MKRITGVFSAPHGHWVGNGFPVRSLFSYNTHGAKLSPFLLLDYAGPSEFSPTTEARGVGQHPHRGFETVTIVYQGEVAHQDSTGQGGVIGPGDVQWMTAGAGILHEEFHSPEFSSTGGTLEMVQLWVNLPARAKMTAPGYQAILSADIPSVPLANNAGQVRVIAGELDAAKGPAQTHSAMHVWDLSLNADSYTAWQQPEGWTTALVVLSGQISVNGNTTVAPSQMATLAREGSDFSIVANSDARVLLLAGEPLDEPVVGYGPFVMNSQQEIVQAIQDFNSGRFGQMAT